MYCDLIIQIFMMLNLDKLVQVMFYPRLHWAWALKHLRSGRNIYLQSALYINADHFWFVYFQSVVQ